MLALFASWHNSAFCVDGCAGCGAPATPRETQLAQQLAMHVVAARPTYLSSSNIDALALQQHLELVTQQVCALSLPSLFSGHCSSSSASAVSRLGKASSSEAEDSGGADEQVVWGKYHHGITCAREIKDMPCLRRFSEVCLLDQPFVVDDSMSVKVR